MYIIPQTEAKQDEELCAAREAEAYAMMMDKIMIDIDLLDPANCPPDRRYLLADKEAWVYEHGNICELVYVRTHPD